MKCRTLKNDILKDDFFAEREERNMRNVFVLQIVLIVF